MWRWDQQEPFGVNVPDENPSDLGEFEFPLRFPGQYSDKETNLLYNHFRDYDSGLGRYAQSDPIGLRGGINTYLYAADPLTQIDPLGLMGQGSGANNWKLVPKKTEPPGGYWGWEAQGGYGIGKTKFTCTDECNRKRTFIYKKTCLGAALGLGFEAGMVQGVNGKKCRPETYAGWFLEGGISIGPLGLGADIGFNEDGPPLPSPLQRLTGAKNAPNSISGAYEGGAGLGAGAAGKLTYCYYVLIKEE